MHDCRHIRGRAASPHEANLSGYRGLIKTSPGSRRWVCIESLDLRRAVSLIGTDGDESSWREFDDDHRSGLRRLEGSGADFAVMASNTPHHRYAAIVEGVGIPVLNMFEALAGYCALEGRREILILGTALTMRSQVLRDAFTAQDIAASAPDAAHDRETVQALITRLQRGVQRASDDHKPVHIHGRTPTALRQKTC